MKNWKFNITDIQSTLKRKLAEGIHADIVYGENVMISVVQLKPYAKGTLHSHPEEQWGLLIEGECIRFQGGEEKAMTKGDFWYTPGNVEHTVIAGPQGAIIFDIFSPVRKEYLQQGESFINSK